MGQLDLYTTNESATCREALENIDANEKGFLVVLDCDSQVVGTLTDGDLRRALLRGVQLDESIGESNVFCQDYLSVPQGTPVNEMIEIFKNQHLVFLPIVNENNGLAGIITKRQLHAILLQSKNLPEASEIIGIDESVNDFEIFSRPWGIYKTTLLTDFYQQKLLKVNPRAKLSLQYHNLREEHWVFISGEGVVQLGKSFIPVTQGSIVFVPRGCNHRISNTSENKALIVSETQIGTYFGEDDIVRIEDIYGRV